MYSTAVEAGEACAALGTSPFGAVEIGESTWLLRLRGFGDEETPDDESDMLACVGAVLCTFCAGLRLRAGALLMHNLRGICPSHTFSLWAVVLSLCASAASHALSLYLLLHLQVCFGIGSPC